MLRRGLLFCALLAAVLVHCSSTPRPKPLACEALDVRVVPALDNANWPVDTVFGFADLHAHVAIERAFDKRLIWGTVLDEPLADANVLQQIASCPVETHKAVASSALDRAVGGKLFPFVAEVSGYAHAPVGVVSQAWPNARDVIHQGMSVSGIRRAYEGGLRLMFASTTDDQAFTALLTRPDVMNGFVPSKTADFESAKSQLELIRTIALQNDTWMGIARDPDEARALIGAGKLALVLSLEMNGLQEKETDELVATYDVRHTIPIHLIDNDVGGTAASGDLFNLSTSGHSPIYRSDGADLHYMDLAATPRYSRPEHWPLEVYTAEPPVYLEPNDVPYARYAGLCYEPLGSCAGPTAERTTFVLLGQENARGLCSTFEECKAGNLPGKARIQRLMERRSMLVDVQHMGRRSVRDTLDIDPSYPLIASHGDVSHVCEKPESMPCDDDLSGPMNEGKIEADFAREIVKRHGVLGMGTGAGSHASRTVFAARGGPLMTLTPDAPAGCVAPKADGCRNVPPADALESTKTIDALEVATNGGIPSDIIGNAHAFVRVEMRSRVEDHFFQHRVVLQPMLCTTQACSATVMLRQRDEHLGSDATSDKNIPACFPLDCQFGTCGSTAYTVDDIESVRLEWQYHQCDAACQAAAGDSKITLRQCGRTWKNEKAPHWRMNAITVGARLGDGPPQPLVSIDPLGTPVVDLGDDRGAFVVYDRTDRPSIASKVPATGKLLKVSMRSGAMLVGASPSQHGANVCIALRQRDGKSCVSTAPPLESGTTECTKGWTSLNQHGTWAPDVTIATFVRSEVAESKICGIDVTVRDWNQPSFMIEDVRVAAVEDPVGRIVRRYAMLSRQIANGQVGRFAWGTDFNGLNGLTDISELPVPDGAIAASICPIAGAPAPKTPAPLALMRIRDAKGNLGNEVRIEERGFATYGLFADMMSIIKNYPDCGEDVYRSLMLSAEATLRAWEWATNPRTAAIREAAKPLPVLPFACNRIPGLP